MNSTPRAADKDAQSEAQPAAVETAPSGARVRIDKAMRAAAKRRYRDLGTDLEIDADAQVTEPSAFGSFVQAWLWVPLSDLGAQVRYVCRTCARNVQRNPATHAIHHVDRDGYVDADADSDHTPLGDWHIKKRRVRRSVLGLAYAHRGISQAVRPRAGNPERRGAEFAVTDVAGAAESVPAPAARGKQSGP